MASDEVDDGKSSITKGDDMIPVDQEFMHDPDAGSVGDWPKFCMGCSSALGISRRPENDKQEG